MRRMAVRIWPIWLALVVVVGAALVACGAGSSATVSCSSNSALVCSKSVQVDGAARTVLATQQGKTLYAYKPDTTTSIACTGPCALAWPPLTTSSGIPTTLDGLPGTLGVMSGGNGQQVIYNGHPLYSYSFDTGVADARGQGAEGGNWSVAPPDIAPLGGPATTPATPTPTSGSYGY